MLDFNITYHSNPLFGLRLYFLGFAILDAERKLAPVV